MRGIQPGNIRPGSHGGRPSHLPAAQFQATELMPARSPTFTPGNAITGRALHLHEPTITSSQAARVSSRGPRYTGPGSSSRIGEPQGGRQGMVDDSPMSTRPLQGLIGVRSSAATANAPSSSHSAPRQEAEGQFSQLSQQAGRPGLGGFSRGAARSTGLGIISMSQRPSNLGVSPVRSKIQLQQRCPTLSNPEFGP